MGNSQSNNFSQLDIDDVPDENNNENVEFVDLENQDDGDFLSPYQNLGRILSPPQLRETPTIPSIVTLNKDSIKLIYHNEQNKNDDDEEQEEQAIGEGNKINKEGEEEEEKEEEINNNNESKVENDNDPQQQKLEEIKRRKTLLDSSENKIFFPKHFIKESENNSDEDSSNNNNNPDDEENDVENDENSPLMVEEIEGPEEYEEDLPMNFRLKFTYDSLDEVKISIFLIAAEKIENNYSIIETKYDNEQMCFISPKGINQEFSLPAEKMIDLSKYSLDELIYDRERSNNLDMNYYPMIITLAATNGNRDDDYVGIECIEQQTSYFTLVKNSDNSYSLKAIKVTAMFNDHIYNVHDIYGIDKNVDKDAYNNDSECVICITEDRDTTLLPCRHMCLCSECAELFRVQTDKCPICRSHVGSYLRMRPFQPNYLQH
eukprot:TRINITY_DN549_c0_g1_i1.p1 TRINITY_DN549_c0_g1~~TRINITY_DN549_c0_g1_i1.p1  ORF type:complete len:432 (-),score=154.20 TRINITY_DN549_c0_g1_i1:53-1348(-)